jgi:Uma2 family endonuclease
MATTKLWTAEDVEQLPDDDLRYALIRGVLHRMPPPNARHGRIVSLVGRRIGNYVEEHRLGVVYDQSGFVLERDPDTLLEPDLSFVRREHVPLDEDAYPELAPDLVVEVVSPSQTGISVREKVAIYLATGVRLVWVIDPLRRIVRVQRADGSEHTLSEVDVIDGEDVLPGFQLSAAELFA